VATDTERWKPGVTRIDDDKTATEFEHQYIFVVLDEWSIPEPREFTQWIPSHVNVGFVQTEKSAKIRPVVTKL